MKCSLCFGNHWRRECTAFNKCVWCSNNRGNYTCYEKDLSAFFVTYPICKLFGHYDINCSPNYIILSQLFGPLK